MTQTIEGASRAQIAHFLPDAISTALRSYQSFSKQDSSCEAKAFKEHHMACRVAIAHIELLLKLARWADLPDGGAVDRNDAAILGAMLREAEDVLQDYKNENGDEDE
jgi:hypothetical protein